MNIGLLQKAQLVFGLRKPTTGIQLYLQTNDGEVHLECLRQQSKKAQGQSNFSLADFVSPTHQDYMGAFAVTIHGAKKHIENFAAEHDDYNKIMVQILADRMVEAFAECLHQKVRKEYWGYAER